MTALALRHATVGYPEATVREAVEAAPRECPFTDLPNEPGFAPLVVHWLTDAEAWGWLPPPLTEAQVEAIHPHLVASAS